MLFIQGSGLGFMVWGNVNVALITPPPQILFWSPGLDGSKKREGVNNEDSGVWGLRSGGLKVLSKETWL